MPQTLSPPQIESFRERICEAATRLFAEHGYDGVTLRAITERVGCSPMTPYRYFENKAEILATVRTKAMERFAEHCQAAYDAVSDPWDRLRLLGFAYLEFAVSEPSAYRILFDSGEAGEYPELDRLGARARQINVDACKAAAEAGLIDEDPEVVARVFWSALHGAAVLQLAEQFASGPDLDRIAEPLVESVLRGVRSPR